MKLKNKKTGKIVDATMSYREGTAPIVVSETTCDENGQSQGWPYNSLAELNDEWEDYEEPEIIWYLDWKGRVQSASIENNWEKEKSIGNYFETKEEAEKAVEKLKVWKRLKDKGFRFTLTPGVGSLDIIPGKFQIEINADMPAKWFFCDDVQEDLDDCFGGEE